MQRWYVLLITVLVLSYTGTIVRFRFVVLDEAAVGLQVRADLLAEYFDGDLDSILQMTTSTGSMESRFPEALSSPVRQLLLLDARDTVVFRWPGIKDESGEQQLLREVLQGEQAERESDLEVIQSGDLLFTTTVLHDNPIRLVLAFDQDEVLRNYRINALLTAAIFPPVLAFVIGMAIIYARTQQRRTTTQNTNEKLEHTVQHTQAQLLTAQAELGDLAYVIAHDLKAPLRGIAQLSSWLIEDYSSRLDEAGTDMLKMLIARVERMDELIQAVLLYSKANRDSVTPERIDLNQLLDTLIQDIAPPEEIRITRCREFPDLIADPIQIRQVFQNLVENAIRVVEPSAGTIDIDCDNTDTGLWHFSVADNGPGIDAANRERIFLPLQTLATGASPLGTGMGLAIVRKLVTRYGGTIWVESETGKGTIFHFTIRKEAG